MPLKLISLNIEGRKHFERVLPFLLKESADVIGLQEVCPLDIKRITSSLGMTGSFYPMGKHPSLDSKPTENEVRGVLLLGRVPHTPLLGYYYVGKGSTPLIVPPENRHDGVVVYTQYQKDKETYVIGTTHFTWTANGLPTPYQWQSQKALLTFIRKQKEFILCGDFNAPRGGPVFAKFAEVLIDHLPADISSTLDPNYHRAYRPLVVDTIFSTPQYRTTDFRVIEGISDHKALVTTLHRTD